MVFYEAAVRTLVEFWERAKHSPVQPEKYEFPEPELLIHALAEVAWRAFHELGRREIPGEQLRAWLRESLEADPQWGGRRGRRAVENLLKLVRERIGLLIDLGADRYQFAHLSLHEYLVAQYILDRLNEEQSQRVVCHYLHVPEWEEALRLTVADAGQARADGLVRAILAEPSSKWEPRLCRDLRFVCRCLEDKASLGPEVREDVQVRLARALSGKEALDWPGLVREAAAVGGAGPHLAAVAPRLADDDRQVRRSAVEFFARVGADDEETRKAFAQRLADDDLPVRRSAVEFFARVGADEGGAGKACAPRRAADD
ncbi:MAG: hypothetical protein GY856_23975 [bacterium]|nr:hypothetical protein [bacterium]